MSQECLGPFLIGSDSEKKYSIKKIGVYMVSKMNKGNEPAFFLSMLFINSHLIYYI